MATPLAHRSEKTSRKPRVAWFSPMVAEVGTSSPAAYVSRVLLPHLAESLDIEVFHDRFEKLDGIESHHFLTAWDRHRVQPFDLFFYHLEDHRRTAFARMHLALKPGMVWFHDLLLTDDGPEPILNSSWERIAERFHNPSVAWPVPLEEFKRERPHAVREAAVGGIPIFSSEKDLKEYHLLVARKAPSKGITFGIPYAEVMRTPARTPLSFFIPYPSSGCFSSLQRARADAGSPAQGPLVLGLSAAPGVEARVPQILEAMQKLRSKGEALRLIWRVEGEKEESRALRFIEEFGLSATLGDTLGEWSENLACQILRGRSPEAWQELLPEIDVALHLHFSVFGQPGPVLALSLEAGLPCVVSDFGGADFLPDNVVLKVRPGEGEVRELAYVLQGLREKTLSIPRETVQSFARERHDPRRIAGEIVSAISLSLPVLSRMSARWEGLESEARKQLLNEVAPRSREWFENERDLVLRAPFSEFGWGRL